MGIFKNRTEHENYVNSILNQQKNTMSDKLLHLFLWEKIKLIFKYDDSVREEYLDNDDNIIILNDENGIMIIGYLQIDKKWNFNSSHDSNTIINALIDFISDIRKLAVEKEITSFRFIIITTFKLSNFKSNIFSKLSKDVSYFYLAETDENNNLLLDLNRDEELIELINEDFNIKGFFDFMLNKNKKHDADWNCEICDGNNYTGCQFFDPTECPRFS
ncbi:hypothetical protein [Flavobacterium sp. N1719]|uniref:hypothetical protein n=1 Tax=Flavobacterium sp. N1719 TaxID=2885633 RepID=UPI00222304CA|nr:hypothetical protein [Flavobacterium sp. N1719]